MRPHVIVMAPPDFDEDTSFGAAAEPFHAQAFIAELAVEALVIAVLPRLAGIPLATQADAHAPIAIARVRRGDPPHRVERRRVTFGTQLGCAVKLTQSGLQ